MVVVMAEPVEQHLKVRSLPDQGQIESGRSRAGPGSIPFFQARLPAVSQSGKKKQVQLT